MNYYDELGLRREATVVEIRQAYRVAARLVHPDGQADEQVRTMAERQMVRLNEILATLTDAQKRRDYDSGLDGARSVASSAGVPSAAAANSGARWKRGVPMKPLIEPWWTRAPDWAQTTMRHWFWISLSLVVLCVGLWCMTDGEPVPTAATGQSGTAASREETRPPRPRAQEEAKAPAPVVTQAPPGDPPPVMKPTVEPDGEMRSPVAVDRTPPEATVPQPAPRAPIAPVAEPPTPVVAAKTELAYSPAPRAAAPESVAPGAKAESFAGNWLYVPGTDIAHPGSYLATYVEMRVTEARGELSGTYRAQYKISDLAVSPEVSFHMQGKLPSEKSAKLRWTSTDGAKGEVEMTLLDPNQMILTWWTSELGRRPALGSGTTKLIRQQQP